jgi:signal transduction histidine kinase
MAQEPSMNEEKKERDVVPETLRLPNYAVFIRVFGLSATAFFWALTYLMPDSYMSVFTNKTVLVWSFVPLFAISIYVLVILKIEDQKKYFYLLTMTWSAFFYVVIIVSGAAKSPFVILLVFPLLTAAAELNGWQTRFQGILGTVMFGSLIFFPPSQLSNPSLVLQHALNTAFLGMVSLYIHNIVKDTLRRKYEKDRSDKKFFELAEAERVKADFIMVVSHQLRTPLSAARYALHSYLDTKDAVLREALARQALMRLDQTAGVVQTMLSSFEGGTAGVKKDWKTFDIVPLILEIEHDLEHEREKTSTSLVVRFTENYRVRGDQNLLKVAIMHVIENAVHYTPGGSVEVFGNKNGDLAEIVVRDTGVGISANDIPHMFERFYRGQNVIKLFPNASGLGLFSAREIFVRHGGTLELVTSTEGKGTTMKISLPLAKEG